MPPTAQPRSARRSPSRRPLGTASFVGPLVPLLVVLLLAGSPARAQVGQTLWVEGEAAQNANVTRHGWYNSLSTDQFSGGKWISHYNQSQPGEAVYTFGVPAAGQYRFWVRANPTGSQLAYRVDNGAWTDLDMSDPIDRSNATVDGALDHRFIAWIDAGTLDLTAGPHRVAFRFAGGTSNSGILDAFALTTDTAWIPRGTARPGEKTGRADEGYFAWEPDAWDPERESVFNLSHMNEGVAGASGFVRRDGEQFLLGDGTPVRFWTVQGDGLQGLPKQRLDWWAQRLAAYGVNLVRSGGTSFFVDWMNGRTEQFDRRLDDYHALVAALKEQGIYVYINHLYWHTSTPITLPREVFPGFDGRQAIALLFFSEEFQNYYLDFLEAFMTRPNPYTGIPLADDPAVAFLEIQNESNLLFHTFKPENFAPAERALVERKFAEFLIEKHGSLEAAQRAWDRDPFPNAHTPDAFAEGRVGLYSAGHLTDADWARNQRNPQRASDQLQFMVEAQRGFYERMHAELRNRGIKQLISPSNWHTADERILGALEHYTYTATDLVARNSYFGTPHERDERFYRIEPGDQYFDRSALTVPQSVTSLHNQTYDGWPFMITENNWDRPNRFRAEFPFLVSAYGSLAGADNWLFFALSTEPWDSEMNVWSVNDTSVLAQFPATALIFRRGDVQQAETVIHEALDLRSLYNLEGQAMRPEGGIDDPVYRELLADQPRSTARPSQLDPLAFFVGRVTRSVSDEPGDSLVTDLRPYIDRDAKVIKSITDELEWNYGTGYATISTPRAQGAVGFLGEAGRIELDDVVIESGNEYVSILAVSLDGEPLATSTSILVQAGTEDRTYGYQTREGPNGLRTIERLGGYPLNVRKVDATVTLKRTDVSEVQVLEGNGYPTDRRIDPEQSGESTRIRLPEDELYIWVK